MIELEFGFGSQFSLILDDKLVIKNPKCIFRPKADSDSGSFRTPIPVQSGHRFRLIPAIFWGWPESEATLDNFLKMGHDASFLRRNEWPERGYPCGKSKRL